MGGVLGWAGAHPSLESGPLQPGGAHTIYSKERCALWGSAVHCKPVGPRHGGMPKGQKLKQEML